MVRPKTQGHNSQENLSFTKLVAISLVNPSVQDSIICAKLAISSFRKRLRETEKSRKVVKSVKRSGLGFSIIYIKR